MEGLKAPPGKWLVVHGIHKGTVMSRDSGTSTHDSPEKAHARFREAKADYARVGYVTWFAYLYDDQGNRTELDRPVPYR